MLLDDRTKQHRAPAMGEIFKNPGLAKTLEAVAAKGKKGFYRGWVADALVDVIKEHGGILNHEDLKNHTSTFVEPINVEYKGGNEFYVFKALSWFLSFFQFLVDWTFVCMHKGEHIFLLRKNPIDF